MSQPSSLRRIRELFPLLFISLLQSATAQHWDGPSPYGEGFAPDVKSVDVGWTTSYPTFEGNSTYLPSVAGSVEQGANNTLDRRAAKDFYLRIMPLGASITQGSKSSDDNGYRKWLREQLRWKGWKVNMVGSKPDGTMSDKDNEGHPGFVIQQVHDAFLAVAGLKPNLVLVNAGTNDCGYNDDPGNAGVRMKSLLDDIYAKIPGVTVVLSTIVKSRGNDACAADVSRQMRALATNYQGQRFGMADIYSAISMDQIGPDGIHPTDDGYKLFAAVWWDAISKLESVIQPPSSDIDDSVSGNTKCEKIAGNARGPIKTQAGSGHDDGVYVHNRIERGVIESARINKNGGTRTEIESIPINTFFANLVKGNPNADRVEALDDMVQIYVSLTGETSVFMKQNLGGGVFGAYKIIEFDMDCPPDSGYAFGDFNGDGLDDFFCIKPSASLFVSLNQGGSPPTFKSIGQVITPSSGWNIDNVRIADIDGDGRADFCLVDGIDVKCSRNGGQGDAHNWQGFSTTLGTRGVVFNQEKAPASAFQFGDINGDFRADVFLVGSNGNVETWTNWRGKGSGIVPEWSSSGLTHGGQPETDIRKNIKFGKIYGSNRLDYIYIKEETDWFDIHVWENKGGGGTKRKGDGVFYCDMRGTGSDDYVWIYQDGHSSEIYGNTHNPPFWDPNIKITITVPGPREGIHLADWTGNGRCDVLVQDKASGALTLWENQWNAGTKTLTFANRGVVASTGCTEGWGVGIFDRGMRIADMDGDGRADVMCLELSGRITGFLNRASGLFNAGQFKLSEGWDRANLRFADVENSGRADLIWVDKYTGAGRVWRNNGYAGPNGGGGGSSFSWTSRGIRYSPIDRGEVMNFANMGGLGRADLIQVYPGTNEAWTFYNGCGNGGAGGDDGPVGDPGLPNYGSNRITGYVHFGDSYASGMGTGKTSTDKCRVGSNNYGNLIHQYLNDDAIVYQRLSCSGDVVSDLKGQISSWTSQYLTTIGTITVGGNDVGFADLVYYCVITPNAFTTGPQNRKKCLEAQKKANDLMDDLSINGLRSRLMSAYRYIVQLSNRPDFDLYVAGYPLFFNEKTDFCNHASFDYWNGGPWIVDDGSLVVLHNDLRIELNNLVRKLNALIVAAVKDANDSWGQTQIHFVDVVPKFTDGNHRWCEEGAADPDPSRKDTWLFLSTWPDVDYDTSAVENAEVQALISQGGIRLPDPSTCYANLNPTAHSADPYDLALCRIAEEVRDDPAGKQALRLNKANQAIAAGDVGSQDVPWYIPTRTAKTFHPRSPGMAAYRDAVVAAMKEEGSI